MYSKSENLPITHAHKTWVSKFFGLARNWLAIAWHKQTGNYKFPKEKHFKQSVHIRLLQMPGMHKAYYVSYHKTHSVMQH